MRSRGTFEAGSEMESFNPYAPPDVDTGASRFTERYQYSRWHACGFLVASVFISLTYTCLDEVVYRTSIGALPMLIGTAIIAFASVLVTKDVLVSPLCCFVGTVSGDILVGFVRGWGYAQLPVCIVLAIGLSIPSLLIGLLMRRLDGRPVPPSTSTLDL